MIDLSRLLLVLVVSSTACKHPVAKYCDEMTPCAEGWVCDYDGTSPASDFIANTCIPAPDAAPLPDAGAACGAPSTFLRCDGALAVTCTAEGTERAEDCAVACNAAAGRCDECVASVRTCDGDTLVDCSDDGLIVAEEQCAAGCSQSDERCFDIVPSNDLASYLDASATGPSVVLTDGASINTDTGAVTNGDAATVLIPSYTVAAPANGVPLRVFVVSALEVGDVRVDGVAALAVVSDGDIRLTGLLDVSAKPGLSGPGSIRDAQHPCWGTVGDTGNVQGKSQYGGQGGSGHATAGGAGGYVNNAAAGGLGGAAFGSPSLIPLRGGCGGGAAQLVSRTTIELSQSAFLAASGGGGAGGSGPSGQGGGGSGGGILLEAPTVTIGDGAGLVANGGGGGAASPDQAEAGQLSATAARGASCGGGQVCGDGGGGGAAGVAPEPGQSVNFTSAYDYQWGGGGGGAAGYVRINTRSGAYVSSSSSVLSPQPTTGALGVR